VSTAIALRRREGDATIRLPQSIAEYPERAVIRAADTVTPFEEAKGLVADTPEKAILDCHLAYIWIRRNFMQEGEIGGHQSRWSMIDDLDSQIDVSSAPISTAARARQMTDPTLQELYQPTQPRSKSS
jgi:hypothetical protein